MNEITDVSELTEKGFEIVEPLKSAINSTFKQGNKVFYNEVGYVVALIDESEEFALGKFEV